MDPKLFFLILMLTGMVMMIVLAFSGPSASKAQTRRLAAIAGRHAASSQNGIEAQMRKVVATYNKQQPNFLASLVPNPENLTKRLRMTGKSWTLNQYLMTCAFVTLGVAAVGMLRGWSPLLAIFAGTAIGLGVPHKVTGMMITKRVKKFTMNFPDALELMVRGLRSGLPIAETLNVVATEVPGPVGEEFKLVTERIKIGKTMDQALAETGERLGTPEFQFFCITLNIQRETGGNLAETLANLATVLRQRSQMKLKIAAMSSESKASAWIIGSLPFIVFGLISWINFKYMTPFYTPDPTGLFGLSLMQLVGLGGMGWMSIGVFIMAQMINFEI